VAGLLHELLIERDLFFSQMAIRANALNAHRAIGVDLELCDGAIADRESEPRLVGDLQGAAQEIAEDVAVSDNQHLLISLAVIAMNVCIKCLSNTYGILLDIVKKARFVEIVSFRLNVGRRAFVEIGIVLDLRLLSRFVRVCVLSEELVGYKLCRLFGSNHGRADDLVVLDAKRPQLLPGQPRLDLA